MKVCRYNEGRIGLIENDAIYPLGEALSGAGLARVGATMTEIVEVLGSNSANAAVASARNSASIPLSSARLLAPTDNPPAIWAAAANYRSHQSEMRERVGSYDRSALSPDELMAEIFLKPSSAIIGPGETVVLPKMARHVDYECELCAVIGAVARNVSVERALDYVFGYTLCWDISIRDPWGRRPNTRNIRKGFDTFCGVGPWFVTRDEVPEPQNLYINVTQNGRQVMQAHTAEMINGIRDLIRFLSSVSTLKPGTLITTGTPAGVSQLAVGDHLQGTITLVGTMELNVGGEA
jgi:2-keto-4-pentenoate hydratase/2-oxohepta-3-ene-1,7-dioic acid hydratase in catechol pathway